MSRKIILALLPAVLGFGLALATTTRPLTSAEATAAVGGVCFDDLVCDMVATCHTYNYSHLPTCPHSLGACLTCEFATTDVWNCVSSVGNSCNSHGGGQTECGKELVGTCPTQAVCSNLVDWGTFCNDGPNCDSKCP